MKRIILFLVCFVLLERFTYLQTGGFSPYKIICSEQMQITVPNKGESEAAQALAQPFHYLGKGVQFFAFESEDKKYVLKFIKHQRSSPRFWLKPGKHRSRLAAIITSCQIAYEDLREETALVALHLQPEKEEKEIQLFDNLNIAHTIDINKTSYVLQKKAKELSTKPLDREMIDSILDLVKKRRLKGVHNGDVRLRNFGLLDGQLIEIDIGAFTKSDEENSLEEECIEMKTRLDKDDKKLAEYLSQKMENR